MKKTFIIIKNAKIFLIKNDKRMNAVGVSNVLMPGADVIEFGTGAGGELSSCNLQIKFDKNNKIYYVIIGKSPKTTQTSKWKTINYQGYAKNFDTKESAESYYNELVDKIHTLGGNIVEYDIK